MNAQEKLKKVIAVTRQKYTDITESEQFKKTVSNVKQTCRTAKQKTQAFISDQYEKAKQRAEERKQRKAEEEAKNQQANQQANQQPNVNQPNFNQPNSSQGPQMSQQQPTFNANQPCIPIMPETSRVYPILASIFNFIGGLLGAVAIMALIPAFKHGGIEGVLSATMGLIPLIASLVFLGFGQLIKYIADIKYYSQRQSQLMEIMLQQQSQCHPVILQQPVAPQPSAGPSATPGC